MHFLVELRSQPIHTKRLLPQKMAWAKILNKSFAIFIHFLLPTWKVERGEMVKDKVFSQDQFRDLGIDMRIIFKLKWISEKQDVELNSIHLSQHKAHWWIL
jgi:hypothetical protein